MIKRKIYKLKKIWYSKPMFENLNEKSIFNVKKEIISLLKNSKNPFVAQSPVLDANILLCHFLNLSKTALICNDSRILKEAELDTIQQGIEKRLSGLPVAYITKHKEFFGYDFYVDQNVLIPKPDTELLVEQALLAVDKVFVTAPEKKADYKIADVCTGSGCIAISVLKTLFQKYGSSIKVAASDISKAALAVAEKNADTLLSKEERQNISFYQGDLFQAFSSSENQKFDMILSNPPYVPTNLTEELLSDGRSEPRLALDGESDGLGIIRRLVVEAKNHLKEGGVFFLEAGEYNVEEARKCLLKAGFTDIFIHKDLAGLLRLVEAHIN